MKPTLLLIAGLFMGFAFSSYGPAHINKKRTGLITDSLTKKELIDALSGFLAQKDSLNKQNKFVLKEDILEMSAELDEMKGMEKGARIKDGNYYKAYIINIVDLSNNNFLIQLSYMRVVEKTPVLRASFRLLAKKKDGRFYFYSPLKQNTISWKTRKISNITFHFKDTLYTTDAKDYLKTIVFYDKKLQAPPEPIEFYYCDNFSEVLQISGIDYKTDYNGVRYNDITSHENNSTLEVNGGFNEKIRFDRHDLWHDRLHRVLSVEVINRPVDEGCAYLYGGSWGMSWHEVLAMLKKYASENPYADWLNLYINQNKLVDDSKPIYVAYAINALIVQKIEKEKGFGPVMELLSCGKRETGDENYFKALEKVSGITKAGFNDAVWGLIRE